MPQVRCPQCGALNSTDAPDYPFCVGCQDNLARCECCQWFDVRLRRCTSLVAGGLFDAAADATPPCDQHTPRGSVLAPRQRVWPLLTIGLVVALALVYAVIRSQTPVEIPPQPPRDDLRLTVEADLRGATVGKPYVVVAEIRNVTGQPVGGIRLQLSKASLGSFRLVGTLPRADALEDMGEWKAYIYADLQPHETRRIVLDLIPTRPGSHHLEVRLVSRGSREYHGLADFPVRVSPALSQAEQESR